jgi:hypothetical protein
VLLILYSLLLLLLLLVLLHLAPQVLRILLQRGQQLLADVQLQLEALLAGAAAAPVQLPPPAQQVMPQQQLQQQVLHARLRVQHLLIQLLHCHCVAHCHAPHQQVQQMPAHQPQTH